MIVSVNKMFLATNNYKPDLFDKWSVNIDAQL